MHVKSDVFCAGSVILPDKGGRQINVGGWSLDSTYGVRLYYPDGSDGVNGTHDWEESYPALKLQVINTLDRFIHIRLTCIPSARPLVSYSCNVVERFDPCYGW